MSEFERIVKELDCFLDEYDIQNHQILNTFYFELKNELYELFNEYKRKELLPLVTCMLQLESKIQLLSFYLRTMDQLKLAETEIVRLIKSEYQLYIFDSMLCKENIEKPSMLFKQVQKTSKNKNGHCSVLCFR
ncbi:DUF7006 family protein [Enterococcus termitis]|uniref:Uncharacterized protein n=1 Tax=Enterococcus termitis TaxID=332950 RepID=A0A1E5GVS5_9ENTE|nr:hypothetical protein [Enterococcus termitis]OEG16766.1 hypothetical protein BCR25_04000 [Enterococcus termitis]OJG99476.1 hypothetical protein RV18_GL001544 [Enterococcus termitis]